MNKIYGSTVAQWANYSKFSLNKTSSSRKSGRIVSSNDYKLNHYDNRLSSNEFNRFIQDNSQLLRSLEALSDIDERLDGRTIQSRDDLVDVLVESVQEKLNSYSKSVLDTDFLKKHVQITQLLASDIDNISDFLNENQTIVDLLSMKPTDLMQKMRNGLASKAAGLFDEDHILADETLYQDRPEVAHHLIANPSKVNYLTAIDLGTSRSTNFLNTIDEQAYISSYENEMHAKAAEIVNMQPYNTSYLAENSDLSELIIAAEVIGDLPTMAMFLRDHPELGLENITVDQFNINNILQSVNADQAGQIIGASSDLTDIFLQNELGVSRAIIENTDFRNKIVKNKESIEKILLIGSISEEKDQNSFKSEFVDALSKSFSPSYNDLPSLYSYIA